MDCTTNQAVVFTKPVHHLDIALTPEELNRKTLDFFGERGFSVVTSRSVTGPELATRAVIRRHYQMYSEGSYGDASMTDDGKIRFEEAYGQRWDDEVAAGRILSNPDLLRTKGISAHELYLRWNALFGARKTEKIQDGVIVAWVGELDCYCINAFYPAMEENFYHPDTHLDYHVLEFDPATVSWAEFRREVLGATDSSKAMPGSFRSTLYAEHRVQFPGRDNFVHGSAGPLEGFVERIIHEPEFNAATSPVGRYLAERGVSLDAFSKWKSSRSISEVGALFDQTEEMDCADAFAKLDAIRF